MRVLPSLSTSASVVPVVLAALACGGDAEAAAVTATVTDRAGRPLAGAVVTLEADGARTPVKPMAGVEIVQAKRAFVPEVSVVTVGTPVMFPNQDTVRHHVYSFSAAKAFELKLYVGTPSAPVVFDKPGVVVVGCNIHDQMAAWIVVVDTPHVARSTAGGVARLDGVAAGVYRLRVWHQSLPDGAVPPAAPLRVGAADVEHAVRLDVATAP